MLKQLFVNGIVSINVTILRDVIIANANSMANVIKAKVNTTATKIAKKLMLRSAAKN